MEKLNLVLKIARQYEGEYVFVNVLKAFKDKEKMHEFVRTTSFQRAETINGVQCVCEMGIIEDVDVD